MDSIQIEMYYMLLFTWVSHVGLYNQYEPWSYTVVYTTLESLSQLEDVTQIFD